MNIPWLIGKKFQQYFYNIKSGTASFLQVEPQISNQPQICANCQQVIAVVSPQPTTNNKRKASDALGSIAEKSASNKTQQVKKTSSNNKASKNKASKKKSLKKKSAKSKNTKNSKIAKAKSNKHKKHKKHHRMESTAEEIELEEAFSLAEAQREENEMGESDTDDFIDDDEDEDSSVQESELELIPENERRGVKIVEKIEAKADEDYLPDRDSNSDNTSDDNSAESFETSEYSSDISVL